MEIKSVKDQNALVVRLTTPAWELPKVIGEVYGELMAYMGRKGIKDMGMPFVLYHNMDMNALDVEIGWQINEKDSGEGRIKGRVVPGGKVVYALHTGPYSTMENTYKKVMAFIGEKGIKTAEWMYEIYLNSPENTPEEELKTEIYFPIISGA
ncbi:MAG: GyrI-like domain-containing protein [Fibrobacter sp.]|nr:GyrI-like domain-containing protein [Fibrobacter sp.]